MIVAHPSNLARLIDFYGGHMFDKIHPVTKKPVRKGIIDKMPNMKSMREDIFSVGVDNNQHYKTMKEAYYQHNIVLDPHGAVAWRALEIFNSTGPQKIKNFYRFLKGEYERHSVIYETAHPGKFPEDIKTAIDLSVIIPERMREQAKLEERLYSIKSNPQETENGLEPSDEQINEVKNKIRELKLK